MPFAKIPTTPEGRAIHIAAFQEAIKHFTEASPNAPTGRQQDAMVEAIIEMVAAGTTHTGVLAKYALERALEIEPGNGPAIHLTP